MARGILISFTAIVGIITLYLLCSVDDFKYVSVVMYFLGVIAVCFLALCKLM